MACIGLDRGGESELTLDDVDANTTVVSGRLEELDIGAWADTQARLRSGGNRPPDDRLAVSPWTDSRWVRQISARFPPRGSTTED